MKISGNQVTLSVEELVAFVQLLRDEAEDDIRDDASRPHDCYLGDFDPQERVERRLKEKEEYGD